MDREPIQRVVPLLRAPAPPVPSQLHAAPTASAARLASPSPASCCTPAARPPTLPTGPRPQHVAEPPWPHSPSRGGCLTKQLLHETAPQVGSRHHRAVLDMHRQGVPPPPPLLLLLLLLLALLLLLLAGEASCPSRSLRCSVRGRRRRRTSSKLQLPGDRADQTPHPGLHGEGRGGCSRPAGRQQAQVGEGLAFQRPLLLLLLRRRRAGPASGPGSGRDIQQVKPRQLLVAALCRRCWHWCCRHGQRGQRWRHALAGRGGRQQQSRAGLAGPPRRAAAHRRRDAGLMPLLAPRQRVGGDGGVAGRVGCPRGADSGGGGGPRVGQGPHSQALPLQAGHSRRSWRGQRAGQRAGWARPLLLQLLRLWVAQHLGQGRRRRKQAVVNGSHQQHLISPRWRQRLWPWGRQRLWGPCHRDCHRCRRPSCSCSWRACCRSRCRILPPCIAI